MTLLWNSNEKVLLPKNDRSEDIPLTLSWRTPLSYRNQSLQLLAQSQQSKYSSSVVNVLQFSNKDIWPTLTETILALLLNRGNAKVA